MATINGTSSNDILLEGNTSDDLIFGLAGNDNLFGYEGDDLLDGGLGNDSMFGDVGDDTYIVNSSADGVIEDVNEGYDVVFASANFTLSADVEDLILTGATALNGTGNALDNVLIGNAAANSLDGGTGGDDMVGGAGNDTYVVDNAGDAVVELAGGGVDLVRASLDGYVLPEDIENLTLTGAAIVGYGNGQANVITGTDGHNQLYGEGGNDRLVGGIGNDTLDGGAGNDITDGGAGNDVHVVRQAGDSVVEVAAGGTADTVHAYINYTLALNFENLLLFGAAVNGTGNAAANRIVGDDMDNVLAGLGGADTLDGGINEFDYVGSDTASYAASAAAVTANLASGTGSGGDAQGDILVRIANLTGSNFNDNLIGNDGDNKLDGGAGADLMGGGLGSDTYVVNSTSDVVLDSGGADDTVLASVSYRLSGGVEDLTLTGAAALDGIGSSADNFIAGNSNANFLIGLSGADVLFGGAGADLLVGGSGNDTLSGGAGADRLLGGSGIDTAYYYDSAAAVNVNLQTGMGTAGDAAGDRLSSIEVLAGSGADDTLTGSSRNETLYGAGGSDILRGGGGDDWLSGGDFTEGSDILIGGAGNDRLEDSDDIGADYMNGGLGDDAYYVHSELQFVSESPATQMVIDLHPEISIDYPGFASMLESIQEDPDLAGGGNDTVFSSLNEYTLPTDIENLVLDPNQGLNGTGNELANSLTGNAGANMLDGGGGSDTLIGGDQGDYLVGGDGVDTASYATSAAGVDVDLNASTASGGDAEADELSSIENLIGSAFDDSLAGDSGGNVLSGLAGDDSLDGGTGWDTLVGGAGNDTLNGGTNTDTADYSGESAGVVVNLLSGTATGASAGTDVLISIERVTGTAFADTLIGNASSNRLTGGAGNDSLDGGGNVDVLNGGGGDDTLNGGSGGDYVDYYREGAAVVVSLAAGTASGATAGSDILIGIENVSGSAFGDVIVGDAGDNELFGNQGNDTIDGGDGIDTVAYFSTTLVVNLTTGISIGDFEGSDVLSNIENVYGSDSADDSITGNGSANYFWGFTGNDTLDGAGGNDTLDGGSGSDLLMGGGGIDTASFRDYSDGVTVDLAAGTASGGDPGTDMLITIENVIGTIGDDSIAGDGAANSLSGGYDGNDTLAGGGGNDTLEGNYGADMLTGGDGNDVFLFQDASAGAAYADTIADFAGSNVDEIWLSQFVVPAFSTLGAVAAGNFEQASGVTDDAGTASTFLKFDTATGQLYYDGDGNGTGGVGLQLIATLTGVTSLNITGDASGDIFIVA